MNSSVFQETQIASINLRNKIFRSATHEGMADEKGFPTGRLKKLYTNMAKNSVGAIITGYAGVQQDGKSSAQNMLMIDNDEAIPHYKEIVDAVHEHDSAIIMQIAHCGRQTTSKVTGMPTVAPSAIRDKFYNKEVPHELIEEEIYSIIDNFVKAISRAKAAGFDAVQLHCAHGFLLSEFLSPYMNIRNDKWGGSTENRYRIIDEIFKKSNEINGDFPIFVKINGYDNRPNGMRIPEAVKISQLLEKSGCAGIEVSCGVVEDGLFTVRSAKFPAKAYMHFIPDASQRPFLIKKMLEFSLSFVPQPKPLHMFNIDAAKNIKSNISIPVIVVGGIRSINDMEYILENNIADYISMSKPFIIEPNLVKKLETGEQDKSRCIDCNYCLLLCVSEPIRCAYGKIN